MKGRMEDGWKEEEGRRKVGALKQIKGALVTAILKPQSKTRI